MEYVLRFVQTLIKLIYMIVYPILTFWKRSESNIFPPIKNELCKKSACEVIDLIRRRELKSIDVVKAYISRIQAVNPLLNAVVNDRFVEAIREAVWTDELLANTPDDQLNPLFAKYPLLGLPFTVKESCGVKGMSHTVGCTRRNGVKSPSDGAAVRLLRAAGAIPLLISATAEYCFSIETNTLTGGKCRNPYDPRRTAGGSSGGEGALVGAGASLFGIGSDIAGSIRIPSLFNGVFGHKPTGRLVSVRGHFPYSTDSDYEKYLQIGPMTRFANDFILIMTVLAGQHAALMNSGAPIKTRNIKIYYSFGFEGLNGLLHQNVDESIELTIARAVKHFRKMGSRTTHASFKGFCNSTEIALSAIVRLQDFPFLIDEGETTYKSIKEFFKAIFGMSPHTKDALIFEIMRRTNSFIPYQNLAKYSAEADALKAEIVELLGDDGVFFFPTFHVAAIHHNSSILPLWGIDYSLIFNVLGLPATHVPMGLDDYGMPVGFQVVAAPYRDKLCFQIAMELEVEFGGWIAPA